MRLRICPYCKAQMRVSKSAQPDFVIKHGLDYTKQASEKRCPIYLLEGDKHLRAETEKEAIAQWNAFCEGWRQALKQ